MTSDSSSTNRLAPLMDEFVERFRRGERPSVSEYVSRHPDLEEEIRDLFPALAMIEQAGDSEQSVPPLNGQVTADGNTLQQLGDYRIIREVGRGGMGVVYEAEQESLGRHVALKVLPFYALMDPKHLKRFHREARAVAQLHHTNIVPVFGVGEHDGVHFYAMQFIHGQGLDDVLHELAILRDEGSDISRCSKVSDAKSAASSLLSGQPQARGLSPLAESNNRNDSSPTKPSAASSSSTSLTKSAGATGSSSSHRRYYLSVARIGVQVADALAYSHEHGVLHRDVKPSNLLLDTSGTIWVSDFGLAKTDEEDLTTTGDFVGTLRYMAPERFNGSSDARSDIYSFGLTLYEMLTLRPAFDEMDRGRLVKQVTQESPAPPRRLDPNIPRDLETIVLKTIGKEPALRYQSAKDVADDLRLFLANKPIEARRTPLAERVSLWCRRNPMVASLIAIIAAMAVALAIGAVVAAFRLNAEHAETVANLQRAIAAEREASLNEYGAQLSQARANRNTRIVGRRHRALTAVARASALGKKLGLANEDRFELRNEAIAAMSLFGLRTGSTWAPDVPGPIYDMPCWASDATAERFAYDLVTGEIVVHSFEDFRELQRLPGVAPFVHSLAWKRPQIEFSPNGEYLAAHGFTESDAGQNLFTFQVWHIEGQRLVMRSTEGDSRRGIGRGCFAFSPDSTQFYYTPHYTKNLFSVALDDGTETKLFELPGFAAHMAVHPTGQRIAVNASHERGRFGQPGLVTCVELATGESIASIELPEQATCVRWSNDGGFLLTASGVGRAQVWDVDEPAKPLLQLSGHESAICRIESRANVLATASLDGTSRLWTWTGRELVRDIQGIARLDATGEHLAVLRSGQGCMQGEVTGNRACRILSHASGENEQRAVASLCFSPDGKLLATGSARSVCLWDVATGRLLNEVDCSFSMSVAICDQGQVLVATTYDGMRFWRVSDFVRGETEAVDGFLPPESDLREATASQVCFSKDESRMLIVRRFRSVAIVDLGSTPTTRELRAQNYVVYGSLSPDGKLAACSTPYGSLEIMQTAGVIVYEADTGKAIARLPIDEGKVGRTVFSPDGKLLATVELESVRLWRTNEWSEVTFLDQSVDGTGMVAFSPDEKLIAIADLHFVKLFDANTYEEVARLTSPLNVSLGGHRRLTAIGLSFSPDSQQVASRSQDGSILLWDLKEIRQQLRVYDLDW